MEPLAQIIGIGMACPVGLYTRAALAAMRAGVVRFTEVDDLVGPGGTVRASMLTTLGGGATRTERAAMFTRHALREVLLGMGNLGEETLPCFLALPEPGTGARLALDALLAEIATEAGPCCRLDVRPERLIEAGRAGAFAALEAAVASLAGGEARFALVAGLDSLADTQTLEALADQNRLVGNTNLDGIIPGEGAACLLLCRPGTAARRPVLAQLLATAVAREPLPLLGASDRISSAQGLSEVFRKLRTAVEGRVDQVFAGTTGQIYFGREFSHAYLKNEALMPEPLRVDLLGSALGDVGAAAGAICIAQAVAGLLDHQTTLAYSSSDNGLVGACVLTRAR